jgi:hypothetical protein
MPWVSGCSPRSSRSANGSRTFARSQDALADLARQAVAEHRRGETKELDPDSLCGRGGRNPFARSFAALPASVQEQARAAYRRFLQGPRHPSLRFKRVHSSEPIGISETNGGVDMRLSFDFTVRDATKLFFGLIVLDLWALS